ncbi:MAG TPA: helix-turn-helix domain-containing protein [Stellaceae bacterium]|jgi:HTH-type transcriptional regulator/antitoxin HigA|nr:helix-turn-helix domain-containing protein [Stellaceae bacterium]
MESRRLKPIRNDVDYARVLDTLAELEAMAPATSSPEADMMEVLLVQAETYRTAWLKRTLPDAVSAIRFAMAEQGLTQADLAAVLGSRSRASEILAGKRRLSIDHIRRLNRAWSIPAELLIKE